MRLSVLPRICPVIATLLLAACASPPASAPQANACSAGGVERAEYVGPYLGVENLVRPADYARDFQCAEEVKARLYPRGVVTIFGSSRIVADNRLCDAAGVCDEEVKRRNDATYATVRRFAALWTERYGRSYPIMTGAGPGLMDAGNRGAREAGGPSIGYTTYYDPPTQATPQRPYGGDPRKALNDQVTHGLVFSSVVAREAAMIVHSAAIVIAPGGTGTEWETYQVIETIKSRQVLAVPVYLLGERSHWASLEARLDDMVKRRVIRRDEVAFLRFATTADELAAALRSDLRLP